MTRLHSRAAWCCAMILLSAGALGQTPGAGFVVLDLLPGTTRPVANGMALSDDAQVIVGTAFCAPQACGLPVRWNASGRLTVLPSGGTIGFANDVSADGRTIVGRGALPGTNQGAALVWRDDVVEALPVFPDTWSPDATAISADGRAIAGHLVFLHTQPYPGIVRWMDGKVEDLSLTPGDATPSYGEGIDGSGRFIVGLGFGNSLRAIRVGERVEDLGDLPGAQFPENAANDVNHDGSRVVGSAASSSTVLGREAFLWTAPTGMVALGALPYRLTASVAASIAKRAPIIVGFCGTNTPYQYIGFVWDPIHGMRSLNDIIDSHGLNRDGWFIDSVNAVTPTGTAMTGSIRKGVERRAFLITLPPWCHADCDASGHIDFNDFLCFLNRYNRAQADPRAHPVDFVYADFQLDDTIDFADVLEYLRLYSAGCPR